MSKHLDFPIKRLPRQLTNEFGWEVNGEIFRYVAKATDFKWSESAITGLVTLTKFKKPAARHWWNRKWKRVWCFSTGILGESIISEQGLFSTHFNNLRGALTKQAINAGIMPTDLLLDRALGPIEAILRKEQSRILHARQEKRLSIAS